MSTKLPSFWARLRGVLIATGILLVLSLAAMVLIPVYILLWEAAQPLRSQTIVGCLGGVVVLTGGLLLATWFRTRRR